MKSSRARAIFLLAALIVAPLVSADTIRFDPPAATVHHAVDAIVSGIWADACVPSIRTVSIAGSTITLRLSSNLSIDAICYPATTAYSVPFHLDVLPAGSYTVIARADRNFASVELARTTLNVRDTESLTLLPYAVPASGGRISLANPFYLAAVTVMIGGVTVPAETSVDGALFVTAPPHAAGAADVAVTSASGTVTAKAALLYYDPAAADPAVFEPILFPLSFQGPGAYGSQWTTESFLFGNSSGSMAFFRDALPCADCPAQFGTGSQQLSTDTNPWGHVLYAMRGTTGQIEFASRVRDTSRQSQTAGTAVPVVRERDFRQQLRFLNVPSDTRYRTTLRFWSLGDYPQFLVVTSSTPTHQIPLSVTRIPGTALWFGTADVTALVTNTNGARTNLSVYPSGFPSPFATVPSPASWGMLSITNNETQQVTILTP